MGPDTTASQANSEGGAPSRSVTDTVPIGSRRQQELEDERDFLLESLTDLEDERAAGDIEDDDYRVLRDGYTRRAAEVLRELEVGAEPVASAPRGRGRSIVIASGLVVVLFAALWWGLSTFSAQRLPDQTITGLDPRSERQQLLSQAYQVQFERPAEAAAIYQLVLDEYPEDVEALTYGGWTRSLAVVRADVGTEVQVAELTAGAEMLTEAIELDPTYPDPRCLRGVLYGRFLEQAEPALDDLDECLALNPPADMRDLISGLRDELVRSAPEGGGERTADTVPVSTGE